MSIEPIGLYPPQPKTTRGLGTFITYDKVCDRIAYAMGRSIFVKPVDPTNTKVPSIQFTKHNSPTTVASFSPSGMYIASGDESGNVKIWDTSIKTDGSNPLLEQPYIKSEFQILSGPIKSIRWDADNTRIIAVGEGKDKFGHCFTWDSGNSIGEIQGHSDVINAVDIKPQRPYRAATVGNDKALVFYNGPPFKFDKSIRDYHTNVIRDVKFSPDGKYLISVGSDRLIVVYDGKTGDFIKKIENAHNGGIFGVYWFSDSSKFATCSADNKVKIWDNEFNEIDSLSIEEKVSIDNQLVNLIITKDDLIISLSVNGNLNYYNTKDKSFKIVNGHQSSIVSSLKLSKSVITGGSDGKIYKWEFKEGSEVFESPKLIGEHDNYVNDIVTIDNDDDTLCTIGWDDKLKVWDIKDESKLIKEIKLNSQPRKLIYNNDKLTILFENSIENYSKFELIDKVDLKYDSNDIDSLTNQLLLTNLNDNKIESTDVKFDSIRGTPAIIRVSPDNQYIALGDFNGKYIIYNSSDNSVKTTRWSFQTSKITDGKWSKDSKYLLTVGLDCGIFIYNIEKISKVIKYPLAHQSGISRVEWITDEIIMTTGLDGAIKLWKVKF